MKVCGNCAVFLSTPVISKVKILMNNEYGTVKEKARCLDRALVFEV